MALHDAPTCTMLKRLKAGPILCNSPQLTREDHKQLSALRKVKLVEIDKSTPTPRYKITKDGQRWLFWFEKGGRIQKAYVERQELRRRQGRP